MAVLHPTAANKTRPNDSNDVFCCLEIKNRSLHLRHQNLTMQKMSIIRQLKREGTSTEVTGEGLKLLLKEDTEFTMGSLAHAAANLPILFRISTRRTERHY